MLMIKYFASLREALGVASERIAFVNGETVNQLLLRLAEQHPQAKLQLLDGSVRAAVNQQIVEAAHPLSEHDEVAFFPPVTGG